jgi:hypothetical protein
MDKTTKARQDEITKRVMAIGGALAITVNVGTKTLGFPTHQILTAASLLLPIVGYLAVCFWFRHRVNEGLKPGAR